MCLASLPVGACLAKLGSHRPPGDTALLRLQQLLQEPKPQLPRLGGQRRDDFLCRPVCDPPRSPVEDRLPSISNIPLFNDGSSSQVAMECDRLHNPVLADLRPSPFHVEHSRVQ